jgi:hypothetical protein
MKNKFISYPQKLKSLECPHKLDLLLNLCELLILLLMFVLVHSKQSVEQLAENVFLNCWSAMEQTPLIFAQVVL